jgi:hypothetical protein
LSYIDHTGSQLGLEGLVIIILIILLFLRFLIVNGVRTSLIAGQPELTD